MKNNNILIMDISVWMYGNVLELFEFFVAETKTVE